MKHIPSYCFAILLLTPSCSGGEGDLLGSGGFSSVGGATAGGSFSSSGGMGVGGVLPSPQAGGASGGAIASGGALGAGGAEATGGRSEGSSGGAYIGVGGAEASGGASEQASGGAPGAGGTAADSGGAPAALSYAGDIEPLFLSSCGNNGCHVNNNSPMGPSARLDLSMAQGYANLVGVASTEETDKTRVVVGDATASYLVMKLHNTQANDKDPMPKPIMNMPFIPLPAEDIEAVEMWIDGGALQ